jgi:aspartate/methionine/tyrosine aminotransferase
MALHREAEIRSRNLGIIQNNLDSARSFFTRHPDMFSWIDPQAGSVAFPRWHAAGTLDEFCRSVLEKQEVMIVPGSLFDGPSDHFRVGLGRLNFTQALDQLEIYLNSNN